MKKPDSPCHYCNNHNGTCHSDCKDYKEYRTLVDEFNKERDDNKRLINQYSSYITDNVIRMRRNH